MDVSPPRPRAAVIIPHYNDLDRLARCLEALAPQAAAHPEVEIWVVDNNSPCDMAPTSARFGWARFVTEPTKGAAAARNRGIAESRADQLIFLDSDCVPAADWLDTALRLAGTDRMIGGRIDTFDETPAPRSGAEAFEAVFAFHQKAYVEQMGFSVTANLVTSRHVAETTGPMIVGVSEDKDWCLRAAAKGFPVVYDDSLAVSHPTRQDWTALARKWRRLTEESFGLHQSNGGSRPAWALRALMVAASALAHSPKVLRHPALSARDKGASLTTLWRLRLARMLWMLSQATTGRA